MFRRNSIRVLLAIAASLLLQAEAPSTGDFRVELKFVQGRLISDRSTAVLSLADDYRSSLRPGITSSHLIGQFCDEIDRRLRLMPMPYRFTLTDEELALDDAGKLHDQEIDGARQWSQDWKTFPRLGVFVEDTSAFERELAQVSEHSALETLATPLRFPNRKFEVSFPLRPLLRVSQIEFFSSGRVLGERQFHKLLAAFEGTPANPEIVRQSIERLFAWRDTPSAIDVNFDQLPFRVRLLEALQIRDILLPPGIGFGQAERIFFELLPGRLHHAFLKAGHSILAQPLPDGASLIQIDLKQLVQLGEGAGSTFDYPFLNAPVFASQRQSLALYGYTTATNEIAAEGVVQLLIEKMPEPNTAPRDSQPKKNFIGGGVEYRPGQGVRLLGSARRLHTIGNDVLSGEGGAQGSGFGNVNYSRDYLLFGFLHRRLSLNFSGNSAYNLRRILDGVLTDERRTGGALAIEFEPFRSLNANALSLQLEARRETVRLSRQSTDDAVSNLTTLTLGLSHQWNRPFTRHPFTFRLNPSFRFGLGLSATESNYQRLIADTAWHQIIGGPFEYDLRFHSRAASRSTLLFELPSLGGDDSIRGFRADDALGRQLWSSQSELWLPIWSAHTSSQAVRFIARNFRLATFYDCGGIYDSAASPPGLRQGAGAGLRLKYRGVIFALDWAHGIGKGVSGNGRGRFYFQIRLP